MQGQPEDPSAITPGEPVFPAPTAPEAARSERPDSGLAVLNFNEASLRDILRTVADITKENFIIAPGVAARISVQTAKPVPKNDVFGIFESILEVNGLAAVKTGQYYKIVPSASAKQKGLELFSAENIDSVPTGDRMLNLVVPVEFVSANDLLQILKPMLSSAGSAVVHQKTNTIILTDAASNIKGYLDLIDSIDADSFKRMNISLVQVSNVDVKTLHRELSEVLSSLGFGKDSAQLSVVPVERLNSLILISSSNELMGSVNEWIKKLDKSPSAEGASIHIYYVQNDKASNIKNLLEQLLGGKRPVTPAALAQISAQYPATASAAAAGSVSQPSYARAEAGAGEEMKVFIYEPNNALIFHASQRDYQNILSTVKELDRPPKQVLIEALIAEVKLDESTKYGIQWSALTGNVNIQQNTGIVSSVLTNPVGSIAAPFGLSAPAGLTALATDSSKFFAVLQALASDGKINVLSNPHITVKNYEKASINIGSDEPIATQSTQTSVTGTAGIIQNIEYRKTGVILTVTPQITEGGVVAMTLRQEVSDKSTDRTVGNAVYPSFSKREAETSVVARDRETIVIGGLIQDRKDNSANGIPFLSRIPVLGSLFRFSSVTHGKTELIMLLTPSVISNSAQAAAVTDEVRNKLEGIKKLLKKE